MLVLVVHEIGKQNVKDNFGIQQVNVVMASIALGCLPRVSLPLKITS